MRTDIESTLWLFALASKCKSLIPIDFKLFFALAALVWSSFCLLYWLHPGGPAWGKLKLQKLGPGSVSSKKTIPGPRGFPVIGSMYMMTGLAHRKIASAAHAFRATRLMGFSLGDTRVIVTCDPDVAKELLNSSAFADRPVKESAYSLMFNRAIGFAPYGVYWRTLRRIAATHLFCPRQIKAAEGQRAVISAQMAEMLREGGARGGGGVCVRGVLKRASLDNMMWSVFGRRCGLGERNDDVETAELRKLVDEGYELLGILNWADHLPGLKDFDPQRIRFRCSQLVPKVNRFVTRIIEEHRAQPAKPAPVDFTDVLLSLQGPDKLSDPDMIAVLWEMIFRGTDTVAVLIEWILARMVLHPDEQSKVQNELNEVVGKARAVTESDLPQLVYLNAVVKEVLRLHPPGPLLSWARLAIVDTLVDGYEVPAGTTAMVNMWAIARDPLIWSDPSEFKPSRFLNGEGVEMSVMGSDLRLAPFGSGRRTCPGKTLGLMTVSFWTASLLHEFEWRTCEGNNNNVDLSEVLKLSCEMAKPLIVNVRPRR